METEYRKHIQEVFDRIERAMDQVDPDLAECEQAHGAMTIVFGDQTKCILSAQPSVQQLWLALAAKGVAFHFNWDASRQRWIDDKGRGIELVDYLQAQLREKTGQSITL